MALSPHNTGIRQRSGSVNSKDPLVSFLYHLLRDHLPAGAVEGIYQDHVAGDHSDAEFCNGYLASHAKDMAKRLRPQEETETGDIDARVAYHQKALGLLYMKMAAASGPSIRRILGSLGQPENKVTAMAFGPAPKLVAFNPGPLGLLTDDSTLWEATQEPGETALAFVTRFTNMAKDVQKPKPKLTRKTVADVLRDLSQTSEGREKTACALSGAIRAQLTRAGKDPGRLVILNESKPGEPLAFHAVNVGALDLSFHFAQMAETETPEDFLKRVETEIMDRYPKPEPTPDDVEPQDEEVHSEEPEPSHLEVLQMMVQDLNATIPQGAQKWMVTHVTNHDPRDKGTATYFILWALHTGSRECNAELREKGPWTHIKLTLEGIAAGEPDPFSVEYHNRRTHELLAKNPILQDIEKFKADSAFKALADLVVQINAAHHWNKYAISPEMGPGPLGFGSPRAILWSMPMDGLPLPKNPELVFQITYPAMASELSKLLAQAKTNPDILE